MVGEVKEIRKIFAATIGVSRVWQPRIRVSEFVEERVHHCLDCRQSLCRRILEKSRDQVDSMWVRLAEDLRCWVSVTCSASNRNSERTLLNGWGLICGNLCSLDRCRA